MKHRIPRTRGPNARSVEKSAATRVECAQIVVISPPGADSTTIRAQSIGGLSSLASGSAESLQVVRELSAPPRPVMCHVVAPEINLMWDALLRKQSAECLRTFQRAGGVLPHSLPAHKEQEHS